MGHGRSDRLRPDRARHFAIDERGSIFQDTSDTALTVGTLVTAGTISLLQ